jgi:RNA polymerase sigma factor (sigma-70 family)
MPDLKPSNFERHAVTIRDRIARFAASRLRSSGDAEDLTQRTMMVLMKEEYRDLEREDLVRVGIRAFLWLRWGFFRKRRDSPEKDVISPDNFRVKAEEETPEQRVLRRETAKRVAAVLVDLGSPCRDLLHLWMKGHTSEEIRASMQMVSANAVTSALKRCKGKVREMWETREGL